MDITGARILITGGAGFIGSELVRQLAGTGCHLSIVDNLRNGRQENVEDILGDSVQLHVCDIRDGTRMGKLLRGIDIVFHLACLGVRHSIHSPLENYDVNATGTLSLLKAARETAVARFVYVSSSEVYGTARTVPMSEDHPTMPHTVYGASKLAGECCARAFHDTYGYSTVMVRPFNSYGPRSHHEGDSGEVIPKFLLRCLAGEPMIIFGDGTQTRDFTYVADTAAGIIAAATADAAVGQTINLGNGDETTINALAEMIAQAADRAPKVIHDEPRPGDVSRLYAATGRARELLDWGPRVGLQAGVRKLKEWYLAQGKSPAAMLQDELVHNWKPRTTDVSA